MYSILSLLISITLAGMVYVSGNQENMSIVGVTFAAAFLTLLILKRVAMWFMRVFALIAVVGIIAGLGYYRYTGVSDNPALASFKETKEGKKAPKENLKQAKKLNEPEQQPDMWEEYSGADIDKLVINGETIVVEIYSPLCVTCKLNQLTTLQNTTFTDFAKEHNIRLMRANSEGNNINIKSLMADKGTSAPATIIFSRKNTQGKVLDTFLSSQYLIDELKNEMGLAIDGPHVSSVKG